VLKAWQGILGLVVGVGIGQLAGAFAAIAGVVVALAFDPPRQLEALVTHPLVFMPMLATVGAVQTGLALAWPLLAGQRIRRSLGLDRVAPLAVVLAPMGALGLGPCSDAVAAAFARAFPALSLGNLGALGRIADAAPYPIAFVLMALLPGVSEELLFRGLLQRSIRRPAVAIAVSALLFALVHVDPPHVVGVLPTGFYLAWVAARTGSTWPTIAAHVTNNAVAVLASRVEALAVGHGTGRDVPEWWVSTGLVVTAVVVVALSLSYRSIRASDPVS
jgi:membrane protease YdiL (CAAX protease family)